MGAECFNRSSGFCVRSSAQLLLGMLCSEKLVVRDLGANPSPKALLLRRVHETFFFLVKSQVVNILVIANGSQSLNYD